MERESTVCAEITPRFHLHAKEDGGAASFCCLSAALLFVLGATVGGRVLATAIDSRLLCPGTPSKVCLGSFAVALASELAVTGRFGFSSGLMPSLSEAARVMRGAKAGGAVDATLIVSERLCPGTFANVCARRSLVGGACLGDSYEMPARSAAALDIRGTISGAACVAGRLRALNTGLPKPFAEVPAVEDAGYPLSERPFRSAESTEDETERSEPAGTLS